MTELKNFRIQNQKMLLTYPSHIDKEATKLHFNENFRNYNIKFIEICHEVGDTGYEHSHVLIDWGKCFQSRNVNIFDIDALHPNIKMIKTKLHWDNEVQYIAKQDTSLAFLKKPTNFVDKIWENPNVHDMLRTNIRDAESLCNAVSLLKIYDLKPQSDIKIPELTKEWQICLAEELKTEPDYRKVIWYYDEVGGAGKSDFVINRGLTEPLDFYTVSQAGGQYHLGTIIQSAIKSGWNGRAFIFDLPRDSKDKESIYPAIESVKNGMITALKYVGGTVYHNKPHVVVMANFLPNLDRMSIDRWDIRSLGNSGICEPLTLNRVRELKMKESF